MVKPERFKFKNGFSTSGKVVRRSMGMGIEELVRASNGSWFATAVISLEFALLDGRVIKVNKQVRLRGEQEGKRPHPNPFGRKRRGNRKAPKRDST